MVFEPLALKLWPFRTHTARFLVNRISICVSVAGSGMILVGCGIMSDLTANRPEVTIEPTVAIHSSETRQSPTHQAPDLQQAPENSGHIDTSQGQSPYDGAFTVPGWIGLALTKPSSIAHQDKIVGIFGNSKQYQGLVSVDTAGRAILWAIGEKDEMRPIEVANIPPGFGAVAMDFAHGLIAVGRTPWIELYSLETGSLAFKLDKIKASANALDFTPDGSALVIGASDGKAYRWNFAFGSSSKGELDAEKILERYVGSSSILSSVKVHPSSRLFFSGDWHGALIAWLFYDADFHSGQYDKNLFGQRFFGELSTKVARSVGPTTIDEIALSRDGNFVFLSLHDGTIQQWQIRGFKKVATVQAHKGMIYSLVVSPDGQYLSSSGRDGFLRFWKVTSFDKFEGSPTEFAIQLAGEISMNKVARLYFATDESL
ncbi:MAG: hypothetical protein KDD53_08170, partial [Bdellovibrionales bacterium]|nr:hypothetical protein [Bdellovibrionales bacterium]